MSRYLWISLLAVSVGASELNGALVVSVDLDPATSGIQSEIQVLPNETVTADIWFSLTDNHGLYRYQFSVQYDTAELSFVSRVETPPSPLHEADITNAHAGNELRHFDGIATLVSFPLTTPGDYKVASLTFTAIAPSGTVGNIDILPGLFAVGDVFQDKDSLALTGPLLTLDGGGVTLDDPPAVPEPSSFAALVLCLVSGAAIWKFRKEASSE